MQVVVAAALAVHLVHEEAGDGLQQQAEDGHAGAEAEDVAAAQRGRAERVEHAHVDDVRQDGQAQPHQQLQGQEQETAQGRHNKSPAWQRVTR